MKDSTLNSSFASLLLRILYVIFLFTGISIEVNAQTDRVMPISGTTTVNVVTGDRFFDSGGFDPSGSYDAVYDYGANQNANIIFQAPVGSIIQVTFIEFEVEDREWSIYDNLNAYDGGSTSSSQIGSSYYGTSGGWNSNRPSIITSTGNFLTFHFISDTNVEELGWEAYIEVFSPPCSVGSEVIWNEDFESNSPKGTSTSNKIKRQQYPANRSGGWGMVGSNIGNLRAWESNVIDISTFKDVRASIDVGSWGNQMENSDNISISYSVDGGGFVNFSENGFLSNDIGAIKTCTNIPNGSDLVIRVSMYNTANNEFYYADNVSITGELIAIGNLPNAICKNYIVNLDASGNASITAANINNGSSDVETADANLLLSLDKSTFDCSNLGVNTVTLTVEDEAGNKSTCSSTVTVVDNLNPTALCKNITVQLDASGNASIVAADLDNGSTDNCAITSRSISKSSFSSVNIGANNVILTVADAGGNSSTCNATVTVLAFIPQVSLSVSPSSIDENGGNAFLTATLTGIASTDVLVNLAMSGTASNSDYSISKLQIKVPAGSLTASITISSVNDAAIEGNEILNVSISSITGGTGGATQMVMITIVDDDFPSEDSIEVDRQSPEDNYTPEGLVQNVLVTGCLKADNISYSGDDQNGVGYFSAGTSDFPLSSGVIISTGKVRGAEGRNDKTNESSNIDSAPTDADVIRLNSNAMDVQILEFDFVPAGDKLEFRYLFASEEYPEYACGAYNDVFGFILSGPGISGSFLNGGENIALLPSSTSFVTINNVNDRGCGNSSFYVDGTGGFATQFDGRTIVLTAQADVEPCQTYHIRLIIADVSDRSYDSAVFLEAESFKSNEVEIQNGIGVEDDVDFMYEGCGGSFIKFVRKEDFEEEMTFELNVSGSAENGVDYLYVDEFGNQIGDGKIPSTVTLAAGVDELVYYYKAISDSGIEGDEELRLSFLKNCPCSAPDYYEKVVTIIDVPEIQASPTSLVSCMGATPVATITVDLKSGLDPSDYQYSLDGGAFQDNNVFTLSDPLVGESHTIGVQDRFACQSASFDIVMPAVTPIAAEAGPSKEICEGVSVQLNGGGGIYYEWSCSPNAGLAYLSNVNASNPTVAANIPFGTYTYTLTVKESSSATASCIDTDFMILTVKENSHFTIASDKTSYCSGETISLTSDISNSSGGDSYSWTPVAGIANPSSANTSATYITTALSAKDFSLTVTKSNGCKNTAYISGVLVNPHPVVSLNATSNLCSDGTNGILNVGVVGGAPFSSSPTYNYSWSHDGGLNSPIATGLNSGNYTITVTDSKSCSEIVDYTIESKPVPKGIYHD